MRIPFFPNTGDGTHCFQAVLMMALAALVPDRSFTYEDLDKISGKLPGKWTWPTAALLWLIDVGLEVKLIEEFDYAAFAERGGDYLIGRFGEEVGRAQIANSDIERERVLAKRFAAIAPLEMRVPDIDDIENLLRQGSVVIVNLNSAVLEGGEGYAGHFVVVCEVDSSMVRLHDPGLPPRPNLKVTLERFDRAWGYPHPGDRNLLAIRKPSGFVWKGREQNQ
jgi:hypothetical protein